MNFSPSFGLLYITMPRDVVCRFAWGSAMASFQLWETLLTLF
jgi:hypothetical protein